ncbi:MAG: lipid A deacylase LpxR family protein, partial [Gemmatimonadota bacterium]
RLVVAACLLSAVAVPSEASAQAKAWDVVFENDALIGILPGKKNSDREYTHGLWLASEGSGDGLWRRVALGVAPCEADVEQDRPCLQTRVEFGQKIFTPDFSDPPTGEPQRPFAGWLFGATTGRIVSESVERSLRLELGVTGAPSMAELLQSVVHRLTNYPVPSGWDDQLAFEPGVLVRYGERYVVGGHREDGMRVVDLIPAWHVSAGNVRTDVQGGVTLRAGYRLPHPWRPLSPGEDLAAFGVLTLRERWTGRDLFLDGNTFQESERVERRPFTGAAEAGWGVQYKGVRLTYTLVSEDRLYETQPRGHMYTRVGLTIER